MISSSNSVGRLVRVEVAMAAVRSDHGRRRRSCDSENLWTLLQGDAGRR